MPFVAATLRKCSRQLCSGYQASAFLERRPLSEEMVFMKGTVPESQDRSRDSSYGRLLRRLDQAMDMARTRQWMEGSHPALTELELNGLTQEDQRLLWRILQALETTVSLPGSGSGVSLAGSLALYNAASETGQHH
ncbi:hypothetical protein [uncultured Halopseudomonas sp.]|uniref:hypothetical protein n=1 Tax=uncultured Halopseudomonas sp. TaxID=2901193 RepID=UPI0030EF7151